MGRRWIGLFGAIAALLFAGGDATASTLVDDYPWPEDLREALDRDDQDAAIGGLRQLVEREREAGVPHLVLGVMLVRREETKEALVHLRKALALLPDLDEEMRLDLEDLVFNQQFLRILEQMDAKTARNDLRGAASVARRARGVEGFGGVARLLEGSIEAQRGRASQAQELFDDSIDAGLPDDMLAYAYFGLGVAACSSGDWGRDSRPWIRWADWTGGSLDGGPPNRPASPPDWITTSAWSCSTAPWPCGSGPRRTSPTSLPLSPGSGSSTATSGRQTSRRRCSTPARTAR